jgi:hypothetical protein
VSSNISRRLSRIEAASGPSGECTGGPTVILASSVGDEEPAIPPDAARCGQCGRSHVLVIKELIVNAETRSR